MKGNRSSANLMLFAVLAATAIVGVGLFIRSGYRSHVQDNRPTENWKPVTVVIEDIGDNVNLKAIKLTKEKDNLVLTIEAHENIPSWAGLDADIYFEVHFDTDKDNVYNFRVVAGVTLAGLQVGLVYDTENQERLPFTHLGPRITTAVPLTKIGDFKSLNVRVLLRGPPAWGWVIEDSIPDVGWVEVSFVQAESVE